MYLVLYVVINYLYYSKSLVPFPFLLGLDPSNGQTAGWDDDEEKLEEEVSILFLFFLPPSILAQSTFQGQRGAEGRE